MPERQIRWSDYMLYRMKERGFESGKLEQILLHSTERYQDTETGRTIVAGRHDEVLVLIPIEMDGTTTVPVTVHVTTRQQIRFRLRTGRFRV